MSEEQMRAEFEAKLLASIRTIMEKYGYQSRNMADEIVEAAWQAALSAKSDPVGYVLVPKDPTKAMVEAAELDAGGLLSVDDIVDVYRAMLAAAPPLPTDDDRVRELEKDAARYRWLRKGANDEVAVVCGLGAMDYGMSGVAYTYSEEIDGGDLDAAIDAALKQEDDRQ